MYLLARRSLAAPQGPSTAFAARRSQTSISLVNLLTRERRMHDPAQEGCGPFGRRSSGS